MPIIEGTGLGHPLVNAGAPVGGTDEVQTITIGGTPEAGDKITEAEVRFTFLPLKTKQSLPL